MTVPTDIKYIVTDPEVYGGRPIIAGHRIAVIDVAVWTKQGMTPEQIASEFPLTLAQIHAALAYYYDHQEELDKQLAEDEARLAAYAAQDHSPIMEQLRTLSKSLRDQPTQAPRE
jgi:uncharacterized protein (DUF433 family)